MVMCDYINVDTDVCPLRQTSRLSDELAAVLVHQRVQVPLLLPSLI